MADDVVFSDIIHISEHAKTMTNVDEMTAFVIEENSKLSDPFPPDALKGLLATISAHILSDHFDAEKCAQAMREIPIGNDDSSKYQEMKRAQRAIKFIRDDVLSKQGDIIEMEFFIEGHVYDYFNVPGSRTATGSLVRRNVRDMVRAKKKASGHSFESEGQLPAFTAGRPELDMDSTSGRNEAYHRIAREFMETKHVKFIAGTLRSFSDGVYPDSDEATSFIHSEIMKLALDKFNTPLSKQNVESVAKVLEMYTPTKISECDLDCDNVIVLNNGTFDIKECIFTPGHDPEKVYLSKIPVDYDPDAPEPKLFNQYLASTFKGNEYRIQMLQELTGYLLMRNYKYQQNFYLLGDGGNGKGTILYIWDSMLGSENTTAFSLHQLSDHRNVDYHIAQMHGKYANICGDIGAMRVENTEHIKKLTSGTDQVSARNPYGEPFKFFNYAKIIMAMNKLPKKNSFTTGDKRRDTIISFDNRVSENEGEIKDIAKEIIKAGELPGILKWAIAGLKRLEENDGFSDMRKIADKGLEYERKSNPMYYFVDECIEEDPGAYLPVFLIYNRYTEYRKENGMPELSQADIKSEVLRYCNQLGMNVSETKYPTKSMFSDNDYPVMRELLGDRPRVFKNIKLVSKNIVQQTISNDEHVDPVDDGPKKNNSVESVQAVSAGNAGESMLTKLRREIVTHLEERRAAGIKDDEETLSTSFMNRYPGMYRRTDVGFVVHRMTGELKR